MKSIIDYLSNEAKNILNKYKHCNVGIIENVNSLPTDVTKHRVFSICLYEKNTVFDQSSNAGKSIVEYQSKKPLTVKSFTVLAYASTQDSGHLLGILKKFSTEEFLYKRSGSENFKYFGCSTCDYTKCMVKLIEPYSFLKGGGRMY